MGNPLAHNCYYEIEPVSTMITYVCTDKCELEAGCKIYLHFLTHGSLIQQKAKRL